MASLARVRSASLAASGLVTGVALIAALTVSYSVRLADSGGHRPPTFVGEMAPQPEPVATPRQRRSPPPTTTEDAVVFPPAPTQQEAALSPPPAPMGEATSVQPASISDPHWLQRPRGLDRYYPVRAREAGMEGVVSLDCAVTTLGALRCIVVSETPLGWGFADAALRMSAVYRMVPATREGEPVEGRYRMRVPFTLRQSR